MSEITVTLPDGSSRRVRAGTTARDVAALVSPGLAKAALAATVDGRLVDLTYPLNADGRLTIVTDRNPEALPLHRHSTAHLLAAAVTALFPGAQCGIGPATDEGFFYDFIVDRPFVPEDLVAIEQKMKELAGQDLVYERQMWPRDEALQFFAAKGEPLKVQLIEEKTEGRVGGVRLHDQGPRDVRRLLRRPARPFDRPPQGVQAADHVERLLEGRRAESADAASLGNRVPERVGAEGALAARRRSQEARPPESRQGPRPVHRSTQRWAPGCDALAGQRDDARTTCSRTTCVEKCTSRPATTQVNTPLDLQQGDCGRRSGHWQHYREDMFPPMELRGGAAGACRPMNCPGHILIYDSQTQRSYRELPVRAGTS